MDGWINSKVGYKLRTLTLGDQSEISYVLLLCACTQGPRCYNHPEIPQHRLLGFALFLQQWERQQHCSGHLSPKMSLK